MCCGVQYPYNGVKARGSAGISEGKWEKFGSPSKTGTSKKALKAYGQEGVELVLFELFIFI